MVSSLIDSEVFTVSGSNSMSWMNYINASVLPLNRIRYCCPMILCYSDNKIENRKKVSEEKYGTVFQSMLPLSKLSSCRAFKMSESTLAFT